MTGRGPTSAGSLLQGDDRGAEQPQTAEEWPWRSPLVRGWEALLPPGFFRRDASEVARDLLGKCLISSLGGEVVAGAIVEVEAYRGPEDPASHASEQIGRTRRNRSMFESGGRAYVYRSYGIHWCLNAVTGNEGFPAAVLIRGLDPILGIRAVRRRRGGREPLCAGPGRLCQALGITGTLDGHSFRNPPLQLLRGWSVPERAVAVSGRVGIRTAAHWPLRFYLRAHPQVSRGPAERNEGPSPTPIPGQAPQAPRSNERNHP